MKFPLLSSATWKKTIFIVSIITLFGLVSIFGIKGLYSRYAQDDYCYGYRVWENGFWKNQIDSYLSPTEYSPNRYSATLFNNIAEVLGGPKFVPFLPSLEILAWGLSLIFVVWQLLKPSKYRIYLSIISGLIIIYFSAYLAPNAYQNLFWLAAVNSYLTPTVLTTFILGLIIRFSNASKFSFVNFSSLIILGILAGGFSETAAVWEFSIWVFALLLIFMNRRDSIYKKAKWPLITVITSTIIAIILLMVCPSNSSKAAGFIRPGLISSIGQSFYLGEEFIRVSLKVTPLPYAAVFMFGFWVACMADIRDLLPLSRLCIYFLVTLLAIYLLSVVSVLPSIYIQGAYPGDRALYPPRFTLIAGIFELGWIFATMIRPYMSRPGFQTISHLLLGMVGILLFLYTIRSSLLITGNLAKFRERAIAWDARQQMILDEKAAGETNVIVPQFDSMFGITELIQDPDQWVNLCAAKYYGVKSISAVENYMGIPAYPIGK